jgi:hypothetical protein
MKLHPNSLANLKPNREGSKPRYGEKKKRRNVLVTDPGWEEVKAIAKEKFGLSISELVEQIGRGKFEVVEASNREKDS